jgi:arabinose-5-phosphate isomerase
MNAAPVDSQTLINLAREVLQTEADAVLALRDRIDTGFVHCVELILQTKGRVIVAGIGKTGHIGRKLAATFASTGTPAFFVHAAEAMHGDLGMVTGQDTVIAISYSGASSEIVDILPLIKRRGAKLIAITGNAASGLGKAADVVLLTTVAKEACPLNLAPTASTTAALAMGDALAVACLQARGFTSEDFAQSHPGGKLGRRLLTRVKDVMRVGEQVPRVPLAATVEQALFAISSGGLGMTVVIAADGSLAGLFTDRDLRRTLAEVADFRTAPVAAHMTRTPKTIFAEQMAVDAAELMDSFRISQLVVVDEAQRVVGAFNTLDLLNAGVI